MHDMLRIMDVASTLRRQRETAEGQLDLATAKQRLRERLMATAQAAGEKVSPAEIDAAIEQYFASQHRYEDPPRSWRRWVANLWVMRGTVMALLFVGALVVFVIMLAMGSFSSRSNVTKTPSLVPPPSARNAGNALAAAFARFEKQGESAAMLAADDQAKQAVQEALERGKQANTAGDSRRLEEAQRRLDELVQQLEEEYTVTIVSRPGAKSGTERLNAGRLSGYYLIVEALTADGRTLSRQITNGETNQRAAVRIWGEQVTAPVWERVIADKQADGVVDDRVFAKKQRGRLGETMVLRDGEQPMRRGRQILEW
jgi:hypothetical protein